MAWIILEYVNADEMVFVAEKLDNDDGGSTATTIDVSKAYRFTYQEAMSFLSQRVKMNFRLFYDSEA